jgi:hypothetical protein
MVRMHQTFEALSSSILCFMNCNYGSGLLQAPTLTRL